MTNHRQINLKLNYCMFAVSNHFIGQFPNYFPQLTKKSIGLLPTAYKCFKFGPVIEKSNIDPTYCEQNVKVTRFF